MWSRRSKLKRGIMRKMGVVEKGICLKCHEKSKRAGEKLVKEKPEEENRVKKRKTKRKKRRRRRKTKKKINL